MLQHMPKNDELEMTVGKIAILQVAIKNVRRFRRAREMPLQPIRLHPFGARQLDQRAAAASNIEHSLALAHQWPESGPLEPRERPNGAFEHSRKFSPPPAVVTLRVEPIQFACLGLGV